MDHHKRVMLLLKPSPARESLSELLAEKGFAVDAEPSPFRAVSILAKGGRDVIVVGLDDLPDEQIEVVEVLRETCPDALVVLTFSTVHRGKGDRALAMGADCYVLEPLRPAEVAAALRRFAPGGRVVDRSAQAEALRRVLAEAEDEEIPEPEPPVEEAVPDSAGPAHSNGYHREEQPGHDAGPAPEEEAEESPGFEPLEVVEAVQTAERAGSLRKLGASVAHEINNPLTTLSGWIQLLLKKANGNHDLRRTLVNMKEETDRIADVVRELSSISDPEMAGRRRVDINALAEGIIDCFVQTNGHAGIRVRKILMTDPAPVMADLELMVRAVCDILSSNYLELGSSGSLVFTTAATADTVEFHVYEPGSQVCLDGLRQALDSVDLGESEQIGEDLVLARCQEIIASHDGGFTTECDPREGLVFRLRLPIARDA